MSLFRKKDRSGNVYGLSMQLKRRHHKGKGFQPVYQRFVNKAQVNNYLLKTGKANTNYYRVYHHKYRGYTLYIGPPKVSHGGIRHRPSTRRYITRKEKEVGITRPVLHITNRRPPLVKKQKREELPEMRFFKIKEGPNAGSIIAPSGTVINETQFRIFKARNIGKYNIVLE